MSLTEYLIAFIVGTLVLASACQFMQQFQYHSKKQKELLQRLDKERTIMQVLMQDIQHSGYLGYRTGDTSFPLKNNIDLAHKGLRFLRFDRNVFSFIASPGACFGVLPEDACHRIKENSEVLIVYNIAKTTFSLAETMETTKSALKLLALPDVQKGSVLLISDYLSGDLLLLNNHHKNIFFHEQGIGQNGSNELSKIYQNGTEVVELQTVAYYLGLPERFKNKDLIQNSEIHYSLYRQDLMHEHGADELIPQIEDLKFNFTPCQYKNGKLAKGTKVQSAQITDWSLVCQLQFFVKFKHNLEFPYEVTFRNGHGAHTGFIVH